MHTQQREQCLEIITFLWMACVKRKNSQQVIKIYVHPMNKGKKTYQIIEYFGWIVGKEKAPNKK